MSDKNKITREEDNEEKLHITKSVFQSAKEMAQQREAEELARQEEIQRKLELRRKQAEEARDKRLAEERRELLRLKTGVIEESETIHEEHEEEIKLSFWKKIGNFFYHNKWWLGMAVFAAIIVVYLGYSIITKPRPDMVVLLIGENQTLGEESTLEDYIAQFCPDNNGNGEILASVYYIPYSDSPQKNYANGVDTKMTAELQSAESVIIIANSKLSGIIRTDEVLVDLEELYPDNPNVKGYGFYLKDTDFAQKVGVGGSLSDDWFIALRKPQKLMYSDSDDMQETYDRDFPVFDAIVSDLTK